MLLSIRSCAVVVRFDSSLVCRREHWSDSSPVAEVDDSPKEASSEEIEEDELHPRDPPQWTSITQLAITKTCAIEICTVHLMRTLVTKRTNMILSAAKGKASAVLGTLYRHEFSSWIPCFIFLLQELEVLRQRDSSLRWLLLRDFFAFYSVLVVVACFSDFSSCLGNLHYPWSSSIVCTLNREEWCSPAGICQLDADLGS
mmetsp:Transcript_12797/g.24089  ORF Transcript_12797/g.24089 Transcript_12797/m.24089 type:complete len:200 (-) Transcript_12797:654-1253(-)